MPKKKSEKSPGTPTRTPLVFESAENLRTQEQQDAFVERLVDAVLEAVERERARLGLPLWRRE